MMRLPAHVLLVIGAMLVALFILGYLSGAVVARQNTSLLLVHQLTRANDLATVQFQRAESQVAFIANDYVIAFAEDARQLSWVPTQEIDGILVLARIRMAILLKSAGKHDEYEEQLAMALAAYEQWEGANLPFETLVEGLLRSRARDE